MLERYKSLRQDFLSVAEPCVDNNILNQLKRNYAHEIDSRRKLSQAKDLGTFLRLLEKRDILSYDNIEQLWFISNYIGKSELENKLLEYENWLQTKPQSPSYMYQNDNISAPLQNYEGAAGNMESYGACSSTHGLHGSTMPNLTLSFGHNTKESYHSKQEEKDDKRKLLQQTVLLRISERLGRSWRDVVRHLGIRECEIDAVQTKYPCDLKEQSFEILKIYISQSDKERWAMNLTRALEKGRRRDLKELVEDLIMTHKDVS